MAHLVKIHNKDMWEITFVFTYLEYAIEYVPPPKPSNCLKYVTPAYSGFHSAHELDHILNKCGIFCVGLVSN